MGKPGYHLPVSCHKDFMQIIIQSLPWLKKMADFSGIQEQFTTDWDRVAAFTDPFSQGISAIGNLNTVAANYGEWSNVWQIGMVGRMSRCFDNKVLN